MIAVIFLTIFVISFTIIISDQVKMNKEKERIKNLELMQQKLKELQERWE